MSDRAVTIALGDCGDRCPDLTTWPTKHLIAGTCPRCGRAHPGAWRMAIARRLTKATA